MAKSKRRFGHGTGNPHPVDVHVGERVRQRRKVLGLTKTNLGDAIGLTFQQVQKYERGVNRIGVSRLLALTQALDVSIDYFFEDMPPEVAAGSEPHRVCRRLQLLRDWSYDKANLSEIFIGSARACRTDVACPSE